MTVHGIGGRPRKWATPADRQAAWRARQNGEPEPATFIEALNNGDELAVTIARVEELNRELATAHKTVQALRRELSASEKRAVDREKQSAWMNETLDRERRQNLKLIAERNTLDNQVRQLTRDLARSERQLPAPSPSPAPPRAPVLSRAERRRLEREQRHRP